MLVVKAELGGSDYSGALSLVMESELLLSGRRGQAEEERALFSEIVMVQVSSMIVEFLVLQRVIASSKVCYRR